MRDRVIQVRTPMPKKRDARYQVLKLKQQLQSTLPHPKVVYQSKNNSSQPTYTISNQTSTSISPEIKSDTLYLKSDLRRIALLTALAIGTQLILFLAQRTGLTSSWF